MYGPNTSGCSCGGSKGSKQKSGIRETPAHFFFGCTNTQKHRERMMQGMEEMEAVGNDEMERMAGSTEDEMWQWMNQLLEGGMEEEEQDDREQVLSLIFTFMSGALKEHPGYPEKGRTVETAVTKVSTEPSSEVNK